MAKKLFIFHRGNRLLLGIGNVVKNEGINHEKNEYDF